MHRLLSSDRRFTDHADPAAIGEEGLRIIGLMIERMRAGRKRLPRHRFIDVHFEDMER